MKDVSAALQSAALLTSLVLTSLPAGRAQEPAGPDVGQGEAAAINGPLPARLSDVEGSVRIGRSGTAAKVGSGAGSGASAGAGIPDTAFRHATVNMPVLAGMEVETGSDGRAELQFNNGSVVRLTPNSMVDVIAMDGGSEELKAVRGLAYLQTPDREAGSTIVGAGEEQVRPSAGSLLRFNLDSAPYQVAVLRGAAHFEGQGAEFEADAGQTATVGVAASGGSDVRNEVAKDSWDEWNADRDAVMTQLASGQTDARAGTGEEDSPAWNDLDYYGTWYDVPGAGMAWAPDGVDAGFDPYGSGAWGYYTGVGYTWVSAYPWGWLPYHCGSWRYFEGFGWLWQPGAGYRNAGWYPYTHLEHRPPGYSFPLRPSVPRPHTRLTGAPMPKSQPLLPVSRGSGFSFRQFGAARPEPRIFALGSTNPAGSNATTVSDNKGSDAAPVFAPILPVVPRASQYRQPYGGSAFAGGKESRPAQLAPVYGGGRAILTPGPSVIAPPPAVLPPPRSAVLPAPTHLVLPPPVHISPPPAAVRVAPPAVVAAPRAH